MKTAKEWAEYLPLDIKLWFIEECERDGEDVNTPFEIFYKCLLQNFIWDKTELGQEFWEGIYDLLHEYEGLEAEILTDLEWIDELELAEDKAELADLMANTPEKVIDTLTKENAEFKKRHKTLLKANQESMERRIELGEANMKLLSENTEIKARCEALTLRRSVRISASRPSYSCNKS